VRENGHAVAAGTYTLQLDDDPLPFPGFGVFSRFQASKNCQNSRFAIRKATGTNLQVSDGESLINDKPGPDAIFHENFPVELGISENQRPHFDHPLGQSAMP
jgi:hypothetical protein